MLDRLKITEKLAACITELFPLQDDVLTLARNVWAAICVDEAFPARARDAASSFLIPEWDGELGEIVSVETVQHEHYSILGVDGSQIYPDRHMGGAQCAVLNTGGIAITYGAPSSASFFSSPEIVLIADIRTLHEKLELSREGVDAYREARELVVAAEQAIERNISTVLHDGTLIFWFLEVFAPEIKTALLAQYCSSLERLYQAGIPSAGYISFPKSRDLINLVKLGLCRYLVANCIPCHSLHTTFPCKAVDTLVDAHLLQTLIPVGSRTIFYRSTSRITEEYPRHLRPWFCYMQGEKELVRLEVPEWVAFDPAMTAQVCRHALDQQVKGDGYPVVLAEAHEQAVVKEADRQFFYQMMTQICRGQNREIAHSQKSIKKRRLGI